MKPSRDLHFSLSEPKVHIPSDLPMRKWLYSWLLDPNLQGNHHKAIDQWVGLLIVANLMALMLEHVPAVFNPYKAWFQAFDVFSVAIFTLEYLLRFYLAPEDHEFAQARHKRWSYVKSPFALIDFMAVAPFYLQAFVPVDLRVLRFLRLLRILKLFRVLIPAWHGFVEANRGRTFRQKVHAVVYPSEFGGTMHHIFDSFIVVWVIVSVIAVVLESVQSLHYIFNIEFIILDSVAVGIFTVEYCLRLYCCVENPGFAHSVWGRIRHAKSATAIVDLLAVLPFFLEAFLHHLFDLRFLRVFRLLRLLKLTRYTGATATLTRVIAREWPVLAASAFVMLLLVIMTASLGYLFEHEAQPDKFENIPQSIYWAVITLASVGYGDISPVTPMGRLMTIILALLGIGIFAIPAALLSSAFSDQLRIERETLKNELYEMLADGVLDENERDQIKREAKRLHLAEEEVDRLIVKARKERELKEDVSVLPLHKIAENAAHAVEHYKILIAQIRQLGIMTHAGRFEKVAAQQSRLSPAELRVWKQIQGESDGTQIEGVKSAARKSVTAKAVLPVKKATVAKKPAPLKTTKPGKTVLGAKTPATSMKAEAAKVTKPVKKTAAIKTPNPKAKAAPKAE
jgi:voltage-gated potassium channel